MQTGCNRAICGFSNDLPVKIPEIGDEQIRPQLSFAQRTIIGDSSIEPRMLSGRVSLNKPRFLDNSEKIIAEIVKEDAKVRQFYRDTIPTSCVSLPELAKVLSIKNIHIKDESSRNGLNAFKSVGAYYALSKLIDEKPEIEVLITATDGNHGRGVAWGAQIFKKQAVILVPEGTPEASIKAIESHGATVIETHAPYDETVAQANAMAKEKGRSWALVQDTAWEGYHKIPLWIMQGYLRMCHELEGELFPKGGAKVDIVVLQVGVGSFAGAITAYLVDRYGKDAPKIICVEPKEADCLHASIMAGRLTSTAGSQQTIMAGLNCGTPSALGYPILKDCDAIRVSDESVAAWKRNLLHPHGQDPQVRSGDSGAAVGLAAIEQLLKTDDLSRSSILLWNTEGILQPEKI